MAVTMPCSSKPCGIDQNMPLLALDQLAGIEAVAVDASPLAISNAFHTLTVDDAGLTASWLRAPAFSRQA